MIRRSLPVMTLLLLLWPWLDVTLAQSVPAAIPYAGSISVDGIPLNGDGYFKFAIVDDKNNTLWSNDGTSTTGDQTPTSAVRVFVSNGLYALELGNQNQPLTPAVFSTPATSLRVWFSTSPTEGFELLTPDRQFVSVPYAHQADSVSGTGTVVKGIVPQSAQGSLGIPVRDEVVLVGAGNVVVQPKVGTTNTIEIVGSTGNASAVALNCSTPCVEPAEISGVLSPTQVPELGSLGGTLTDAQIPAAIARDAEVTAQVNNGIADHVRALNAHNFTSISGALSDAQVPATIARDDEVPGLAVGTVNAAISDHAAANNAHALSSFTTGTLADARIAATIARDAEVTSAISTHAATNDAHALSSFTTGTLAEARIDAAIARDAEVPGLVGTTVSAAISTHTGNASAHHTKTTTFPELTGTIADAQIPQAITRDAEVPGLVGTTVTSAITTHTGNASAHHAKTTLFTELTDSIADAQIPASITRDSEVPGLVGTTVSAAISTHTGNASAHHTKTTTFPELTGTIADAQIPQAITRDAEVPGLVGTTVTAAIAGHAVANDAHALSSFTTGTLSEARIDAAIARDAEVPGLVGTTVSDAITAHAAANNAHLLSSFTTGTLADARIAATIARDSEVTGAITAHAAANDAHALSSFTIGTLAEARIDAAIARDSEVPALIGTAVSDAIAAHSVASGAHNLSTLSGTLTDAQVPAAITRDSEVPGLVGTTVTNAISAHAAANDAHALSSFTTGTLADARIPATIARDTEVSSAIATHVASLAASYSHQSSSQSAVGGVSTLGVSCPTGTQVLGGGIQNSVQTVTMLGSWPSASNAWSVSISNSGADATVTVYAVCASIQ